MDHLVRSGRGDRLCEYATHYILVDLEPKRMEVLLGDTDIAELEIARLRSRIAAMTSTDGPLGPRSQRCDEEQKQQAVLAIYGGLVVLQSCRRLEDGAARARVCGEQASVTGGRLAQLTGSNALIQSRNARRVVVTFNRREL